MLQIVGVLYGFFVFVIRIDARITAEGIFRGTHFCAPLKFLFHYLQSFVPFEVLFFVWLFVLHLPPFVRFEALFFTLFCCLSFVFFINSPF